MTDRPNIVLIMTDQQRADVCAREGFVLDTTPFLDALARGGTWFNRAYTASPTCAPARVSMLTGRFPGATRVRTNHNVPDVVYEQDLIDVLTQCGYATAMVGKNHSHLTEDRLDHWFALSHGGGKDAQGTPREHAFDQFLRQLRHRAAGEAAPFPLECQGPYRAVSDAQKWVRSVGDRPFFCWLTFAEPHNPYQVCEPYFSMFPPRFAAADAHGRRRARGQGLQVPVDAPARRTGIRRLRRANPPRPCQLLRHAAADR